jgi:hypothetical protein
LRLQKQGKAILKFNETLTLEELKLVENVVKKVKTRANYDLELDGLLIECKQIDWTTIRPGAQSGNQFVEDIVEKARIAAAHGKGIEFHSANPIPLHWQKELTEIGIKFFEG